MQEWVHGVPQTLGGPDTLTAFYYASDGFHPSAAGYARMAAVVLPTVLAALGLAPEAALENYPDDPPIRDLDPAHRVPGRGAPLPAWVGVPPTSAVPTRRNR